MGGGTAADLRSLLADPVCVAVGECGLDFNRDFSPRPVQERCLVEQLELACELGKPLFLHEREAFQAMQRILNPFLQLQPSLEGGPSLGRRRLPPAVVHCFTGSAAEAAWYISQGLYLGFAGTVCMGSRGRHLREEVLPLVPLDRLLLETDAPFMHPGPDYAPAWRLALLPSPSSTAEAASASATPPSMGASAAAGMSVERPVAAGEGPENREKKKSKRGGRQNRRHERCEPMHVVDVCQAVAAAKNLTFEEVARATTENAAKFFGLTG